MNTALNPNTGIRAVLNLAMVFFTLLLSTTLVHAHQFSGQPKEVIVQVGQSIQAAIDAAQPSSTITISPGIYSEQLTINKDGLSLVGDGAILFPPSTPTQNTCTDLAGNSTNAGICITGSGIQLAPYISEHRKVLSVEQPVRDISITGLQIRNSTGSNIAVIGADNIQVFNNAVYDGPTYGVLSVGSSNVLIANNTIVTKSSLGFIALCTDNNINGTLAGPTEVLGNTISGYYVGLCVQTPQSEISSNDVSGCCIGAFIDPGVNGANVVHNHIGATNPICAGISAGSGGGSANTGIFLDGAQNAIVHSNVVTGQHANGTAVGLIVVDAYDVDPPVVAMGNSVAFNVLSGNNFDLFVNSTGVGNVVVHNVCEMGGEGCA